ncbi:hypothetical protein LINGRAHAP2_LOCUS19026 [Linum grandiflorum]
MIKGHTDHHQGMLDLEKGGILCDDDEFRVFNHSSSNNNKGGSKRKLDRLRSGSLNIYGRLYKEGKSKDGGSCKKPPPKPPRPPRGPDLDDADMKLIREISEVSKVKHARMERLKSIRNKRAGDKKPEGKSSTYIVAMVVTVVFFLIIVFQGLNSR